MRNIKTFQALVVALAFALGTGTAHAASVKGKAAFEGTAPAPTITKADADPTCKTAHPDGIPSDAVIVNSNGTLKNVFVYVKEGLPAGKKYDAPKDSVKFDQKGCHYEPHVFGIQPASRSKS